MPVPTGEPDVVAKAYDAWAEVYDSADNATRDLDAQVLRRQPLSWDGLSVLELGCGTGKNTAWLAVRAASVLALDFSPGMLARARQRVPASHVRFVQHDIRAPWPAEDAGFERVVANLVLEHVEQLGPVFAETARVLRPEGLAYFCELHPFRQLGGGQAHFVRPETAEVVRIPAHLHDVSDYLNAGCGAGLRLVQSGDWRDADPGKPAAMPRLLSLLWRRD
ncbi:MAG TPA: class I SAM-dependent methyltransferase [Myxococcaceae bacterium]|nr:class I SAM-dependent methyltransferase [Myxococcaceae bacterium]